MPQKVSAISMAKEIKELREEVEKLVKTPLDKTLAVFADSKTAKGISDIGKSLKDAHIGEALLSGWKTFQSQLSGTGNTIASVASGLTDFGKKTKELNNEPNKNLSKSEKTIIGFAGAFASFDAAKESFTGLADGSTSLIDSLGSLVLAIVPIGAAMTAASASGTRWRCSRKGKRAVHKGICPAGIEFWNTFPSSLYRPAARVSTFAACRM